MSENQPPSYPGDSSGQQPDPGAQQPTAQQPPGQAYPGQQPYQGQPYGAPQPGYPVPGQVWGPPLPKHPNATTALVLGIVGLVSILVCGGLLLFLSPFAWAIGSKAVREIDANPNAYGGRSEANTGRITGMIGTVLLILGVIAIAAAIALIVLGAANSSFDSSVTSTAVSLLI